MKKQGLLSSVESIVQAVERRERAPEGPPSLAMASPDVNATVLLRNALRRGRMVDFPLLASLLSRQAVDWSEGMVERYERMLDDPAFRAAVLHEDALRSMLRGKAPPPSLPPFFERIFRLTLQVMGGGEAADLAELLRHPAPYS
ncbi:hypothetical protein EON64_20385, partial [archaeon]